LTITLRVVRETINFFLLDEKMNDMKSFDRNIGLGFSPLDKILSGRYISSLALYTAL
jgi:hypothetical protein